MRDELKKLTADEDEIRRDLEFITARWAELPEPAMFEIRAFLEGVDRPKTAKFSPDWIDDAVAWIISLNALGHNCYAVRNPIRHDFSGSASDNDIIGAFFLWADCDDPASAGNIKRFDGPKYSAAVTTGRTPSIRVHVYWELDEPCTDMAEWRTLQSAIAAHFGSDPSVINPSRIMRIGGTVAHPTEKKRQRGYVPERTTIRTEYDDDRPRVSMNQMRRVFMQKSTDIKQDPFAPLDPKPPLDRERTRIQALSGQDWHNAIIRLVASYVSKGLSDDEIHGLTQPLTLPGYTPDQTRAEVQTAINGARAKGWTPADETIRELTTDEKADIKPAFFRPWVKKDLTQIPHPEFIYSDFYALGYTSVTLAPPKVGKSMLGLAEAIDMATGRGILTGVQREPIKVVYYNAEDDQDVIDSRVAALLTHYEIDQSEIEGRLFATSGVDAPEFYMVSGQDGIINEPLFVSIEKFVADSGARALIFDPLQDLSRSPETNEVFRLLGQRLRRMASKCHVAQGLIHHTRKIAPGVTPTIDDGRGGSALRGTARFNRLLISMSEDEGAKAGVDNHRHYMRIADMESNLAPPSADVNRWFKKVSVQTPSGHHVGAIASWKWPDAFDGITRQDAARVRHTIDSMAEPPRADIRSASWAGNVVADVLGMNITRTADKARTKAILSKWIDTDVLRIAEGRDPRAGRVVNVVVCGANDPMKDGGS